MSKKFDQINHNKSNKIKKNINDQINLKQNSINTNNFFQKNLNEAEEDRAFRPQNLDDFIGQNDLKAKLKIAILAAKNRKEPLDHILFSGPPGLGKTSLAAIVAAEMGTNFQSTSAPAISKPKDLARLLTLLNHGDILFIDEIHRLSPICSEILYPAMEDLSIDFIVGEGLAAQSIKLHLKPFTLIGATTKSGMLTAPLKSRFGMEFKLEFYDTSSLEKIIERTSYFLKIDISKDARIALSNRVRMTPRIANKIVRRIRDYASVSNVTQVDVNFTNNCMNELGIDELGLVELDRKLLLLIINRYNGGPVGVNTLAALVNEDIKTLEEDHEPYLLQIGLIEKTPKGRIVNSKAYTHLNIKQNLIL